MSARGLACIAARASPPSVPMSDAILQPDPEPDEGTPSRLERVRPANPPALSAPLAGRVAVIAGGVRGIGRAVARALAEEGCAIAVQYAREPLPAQALAAEIAAAGGRARVLPAELSHPEDCHRMIERAARELGPVDILVNGAVLTRERPLRKMTAADWDEALATNLSSVFHCTKAVIEPMIQRGWGRIVNIASLVGQTGAAGQANHAAAMAGVIAFTKSAAQELGRHGITVNAICPGAEEGAAGRGTPADEVARLVRFLCTEGDWISGAQLNVSQAGLV